MGLKVTISHQITRADGTTILTTTYNSHNHSLTRIINAHIATVTMKPTQQTIAELNRLTQLEDLIFQQLTDIQQRKQNVN